MKSVSKKLKHSSGSDVVNLLWTGGFDSTFRLLQLLYIEKKEVQPIYVIDLFYKSPVYELKAMDNIKTELHKRVVRKLLKPTIYVDRNDIEIDDDILKAWKNIKVERHLGKQYVWFASLCKQFGLQEVELSIKTLTNEDRRVDSISYHIQQNTVSEDEKIIFQYFSFPVIDLTKKEMRRITKQKNWSDIMDLYWFCHHPLSLPFKEDGIPCGICNPCRIAIEDGFGHKIPFILRYSGKYFKKIYNSSLMGFIK